MARSSAGLTDDQVVLEPETIEELIKWYCRESGVRNLQKHIEKVIAIFTVNIPVVILSTV